MPGLSTFSKEEATHIVWLRSKLREAVDFICASGAADELDHDMLQLRNMLSETLAESQRRSGE